MEGQLLSSIRDRIEKNPYIFITFFIIIPSFFAGYKIEKWYKSINGYEFILKSDLDKNYVPKENINLLIKQHELDKQNYEKKLKLSYVNHIQSKYVQKDKYDTLVNQLETKNQEFTNLQNNIEIKNQKLTKLQNQINELNKNLATTESLCGHEKKEAKNKKNELAQLLAQCQSGVELKKLAKEERIEYIKACVTPPVAASSSGFSSFYPGRSARECADEYDRMMKSKAQE